MGDIDIDAFLSLVGSEGALEPGLVEDIQRTLDCNHLQFDEQ